MIPEPESADTFHEIDRALALPKGSAFRAFKRRRVELVENRDFRVLDATRDAALIERLRGEGRIYATSVNVVLLSREAGARIRRALGGREDAGPGIGMNDGGIELIDIGANLTHKSFAPDLEAVLERARQAGLSQILVTGSGLAASRAAIELARTHPGRLFATAGVHPHEAAEHGETELFTIADLAHAPEVHAVGELGLDFNRNYSSRSEQERVFTSQLEMAVDLGKPLFLHQRDAHARFLEILDPFIERVPGAVVHCFTAGARELDAYLERGLHVGITGWFCDERRGSHLRALVSRVPGERLMLETDAPYLLPRDLRPRPGSRRNEPAYLRHILEAVAAARGESPEALAASTTATARRLFRLPAP